MKNITINTIIAAGLLCTVGSVQAEDEGTGFGLGVKGSTLGYGVEIGKSLTDSLNLRVGHNQMSQSEDQSIDGIDYNTDVNLSSNALYLDWHPFETSFHLTAGYVSSANEINVLAKTPLASTVTIGGSTYTAAEVGQLDGTISLGSGPYVGFGWGDVPATGFGFIFEVGAMSMGTPEVDLTATVNPALPQAAKDAIYAEVAVEEASAQDDLDQYEIYPVVALGISYGF